MTNLELIVDRELSQHEVENIYDIINKYAIVEHTVTLNESDGYVDIDSQIQVLQEGHNFEYIIPIRSHLWTSDENYTSIVEGIALAIPDDFEFGVFTNK